MFNKLRNHILFINMTIISAFLLVTFGAVFLSSYHNAQRLLDERLTSALSFTNPAMHERRKTNRNQVPDAAPPRSENPAPEKAPPEMTPPRPFLSSFAVITDSDGNVLKENTSQELSDKSYEEYIEKIISHPEKTGSIKYLDGVWSYKCTEYDDGFAIAFAESSQQQEFLRNLALILFCVWCAALILAFLISFFSADRSIKPVEESYNKQKQFIADASHELKTPLTTINTNVDVLLSHGDSTINEERKWLGYIKGEAERMTKLTNDLLYLARLDYGENNILPEKTSLSDSAESTILTMEAVIYEKGIDFSYDIEPDLYVLSSPGLMKQLVMILLDNAVKYTPAGGNIHLECKSHQQEAVLIVRNTGDGICAEDLKQIFERFYRTDKSRSRNSGGYGLGLAIAKSVAESAKGTISADSKQGEYTEFTVKIPKIK